MKWWSLYVWTYSQQQLMLFTVSKIIWLSAWKPSLSRLERMQRIISGFCSCICILYMYIVYVYFAKNRSIWSSLDMGTVFMELASYIYNYVIYYCNLAAPTASCTFSPKKHLLSLTVFSHYSCYSWIQVKTEIPLSCFQSPLPPPCSLPTHIFFWIVNCHYDLHNTLLLYTDGEK